MDFLVRAFIRFLSTYKFQINATQTQNGWCINIYNIDIELFNSMKSLKFDDIVKIDTYYDKKKKCYFEKERYSHEKCFEDISTPGNIGLRLLLKRDTYARKINMTEMLLREFYESHDLMRSTIPQSCLY